MNLMDIVVTSNISDLSIVGMAKNAGKTVALNYLIKEGSMRNFTLGLTSTGRDGEKKDLFTRQKKPLIVAPAGSIVATARECFRKADARMEVLQTTGYHTPLGEIVIGRVREEGLVEIAGPPTSSQIRKVIEIMKELGGNLVLVDGALDRVASAAPTVTHATVLATGAVVGNSMEAVIERTALVKEFFCLEKVDNGCLYDKASEIVTGKKTALYSENNGQTTVEELNVETALRLGKLLSARAGQGTRGIIIGGALVDGMVRDIMNTMTYNKLKDGMDIIVPDGTKVFLSPEVYRRFTAKGGRIRVIHDINLLAVTVNPFSSTGYSYDPVEFLDRLRRALVPVPVFDLMLGE